MGRASRTASATALLPEARVNGAHTHRPNPAELTRRAQDPEASRHRRAPENPPLRYEPVAPRSPGRPLASLPCWSGPAAGRALDAERKAAGQTPVPVKGGPKGHRRQPTRNAAQGSGAPSRRGAEARHWQEAGGLTSGKSADAVRGALTTGSGARSPDERRPTTPRCGRVCLRDGIDTQP
ncbi:hypothetical protein GCM10010270_22500 [Streptomyces violaceus]|nr:hypothetical protein GCM10010270_22500 [Streptomyces janthinus]